MLNRCAARRFGGWTSQPWKLGFSSLFAKEPWYRDDLVIEDAADWRLARQFLIERYEPKEAMALIQCPFLAIYGAHDVLLPAWQCAQETGSALPTDNPDSAVVVFAQGDHRIRELETGEFVPGYLDLLADWAIRRVV